MANDNIEQMIRHMEWEKAKGILRACVVACGCRTVHSVSDEQSRHKQYNEFNDRVEEFIRSIEENGVYE